MFETFSKQDNDPHRTNKMANDDFDRNAARVIEKKVEGPEIKSDLRKWYNEPLIREYVRLQSVTDSMIKKRNEIEGMVGGREIPNNEWTPRDAQEGVEAGFEDLNKLRAEIERRGLKVPTMEELEKNKSQEQEEAA